MFPHLIAVDFRLVHWTKCQSDNFLALQKSTEMLSHFICQSCGHILDALIREPGGFAVRLLTLRELHKKDDPVVKLVDS